MTGPRATLLMRHGAAWMSDGWYRVAWLAWPHLAALLVLAWLFAVPRPADPPGSGATWAHPIHSPQEGQALKALRDHAIQDPTARTDLERRANEGNSMAQFYMGTLTDPKLHLMPPAPDNLSKAMAWYRKSSDDTAAVNLGLLLLIGDSLGITTDFAEARRLFDRVAGTSPMARRELGLMKQRGWGEPVDRVGGMAMIRDAAQRGDAFAQRLVGEASDKGTDGVAADPQDAVLWLQKAAAQAEPGAERELGLHLKTGVGIAADPVKALQLFKLAASHGDEAAKAEVRAAEPSP